MAGSDGELFKWIKENLYTAVVCDILDGLGYRNQAMHQRLRPLDGDCCTIAGRARTFRWMEVDYDADPPYGVEIEAMDSLKEGDVAVHSTDYAGTNAPWGELMSTISKMKGVAGCICDSQIRDCLRIKAMKFPVFCAGIRPLDSKGRGLVVAYDVPVKCGEVTVDPGDIIFADFDGVVAIPKGVETELLEAAKNKAQREDLSRKELLEGKTLREVFDKYGAL